MVPKKSVEEIYTKKDLHQHILDRPDVYSDSNKVVTGDQWCLVEDLTEDLTKSIKKVNVAFHPILLKIFDEILVNAIDNTVRNSDCDTIKVTIDKDHNKITIQNNGSSPPIVVHSEHGVYIPELIFGNLLTSSNYDDTQDRTVGGLNGIGAKLCNIFSTEFVLDICDGKYNYHQVFEDNMFTINKPVIKKSSKKPYTSISFVPDLKRFKMTRIDTGTISILKRRVYDAIACTNKNVKVYLDGEKLEQKEFKQYTLLFDSESGLIAHEKIEEGKFIWEYAVYLNDSFQQISFVNGVFTSQGGKHVDYILGQIIDKLSDTLKKKKKLDIKNHQIKDKLRIFVKATIVNPEFKGQTKEKLSTNVSDFGGPFKPIVSDQFINKLYKSEITEKLVNASKGILEKELNKVVDKKKTSKIRVPKLDDAYNAGTKKSINCTLILTEGDSAKGFAVSGLSVIGRENYGIMPLKGKVLNTREATQSQLLNNEEINNIKKILGLQHGVKYTENNIHLLRYRRILILADQDNDGVHIRCLLLNFIHHYWPELIELQFINSMKTPIIKATKGKKMIEFYTIQDYNEFLSSTFDSSTWHTKYYKGLGTSTDSEAIKLFQKLDKNTVEYYSENNQETDKAILLAFEKKQADNRKIWLQNYNFDLTLEQSNSKVTIPDLINKELIHFSMADNLRSIPSICDGLKPSQRKVLFTMFKKGYTKEIKVAQLGASVSETTSYHHGEASLFGTIIDMAQDFIGSNNINLLLPNGQFGSRMNKNAASPRYIFTELSKITSSLFNKDDTPVLIHQKDEGNDIEPLFYVPLLPLVLINGTIGIGTGYSTNIPCHNPEDIIKNIKRYLDGKEMKKMVPWYRGFEGTIEPNESFTKFTMLGKYSTDKNVITITEIPTFTTIENYFIFLETLYDTCPDIIDVKNGSTKETPNFVVTFKDTAARQLFTKNNPMNKLKLEHVINSSNYHLINELGKIVKFSSSTDILEYFIKIKLQYNSKRKEYLTRKFSKDLLFLKEKIRFLTMIMSKDLVIYSKTRQVVKELLEKFKFAKLDESFDYLISMPISSFTTEKLDDLKNKKDAIEVKLETVENTLEKEMFLEELSELILKK